MELIGDDRSLSRALGRSEKRMGKFSQAAKRAGVGLAAGIGAGAVHAFKEAQEAEKAGKQTAAVLKSTGGAAKVSRKQIEAMSESLSRKAGIDDEVIQSGANLLLTFKNIRNESGKGNDIFKQATKAAVDMSAGMTAAGKATSIASANMQIGKALNDPIKGLSALTRVGVQFTDQEKQKIKAMVESGNKLGAQKIILKELRSEFGGSAAANATAVDKMKVSFNNLAETAGKALAPTVKKAADALTKFFDQIRTGEGLGGKVKSVVEAVVGFGKAHPGLVKAAGGIVAVGLAIKGMKFASSITGLTDIAKAAKKLGQSKAGTALAENISGGLKGVGGKIRSALSSAKGIVSRLLGRAGSAGGSAMAGNVASTAGSGIGTSMNRQKGKFRSAGASVGRTTGTAAGAATASTAAAGSAAGMGGAMAGGKNKGKFRSAGRGVGKLVGAGVVAGLVLAGPEIVKALRDALGIKPGKGKFGQYSGSKGWAELGKDLADSPREVFGFLNPKRGGGFIPGMPTAADSVPALLSPGEFVLTGHGQQLVEQMAGPGAMGAIASNQAPHFRRGGRVQRFVSGGAVARAASGAGFKGGNLLRAVAEAKGESGWNERAVGDGGKSKGLMQIHTGWNPWAARMNLFNPAVNMKAAMRIYRSQGWGAWHADHTPHVGAAKAAIRGAGRGGTGGGSSPTRRGRTIPAGVTHPLLGNILSPLVDDALMGGLTAGREGTGRLPLLTSVLEGIAPESGDFATRRAASPRGTPRRGSGRGGGGTGDKKGKVVARMQAFGDRITARGMGYTYGGWHPAGNKSGFPDCSGLVSNILLRGSGNFAKRGMNYTTDTFKSWGDAGQGRLVTVGVRGSTGRNAHMMMQVGNKFYESANSRGKAGRRSGWSGSFPIKRHPRGYRRGGVVGPGSVARNLPGRAQAAVRRPGAFDPDSPEFVGWGLRRGGRPKRRRRPASLRGLTRGLAGRPGARGADRLTRQFSGRVQGRSMGALVKARKDILRRIRAMSRNGLTGDERIQVRRLRGALTLIEDEMGRPIGEALGASDSYQADTEQGLGGIDDELTLSGVDPESLQGLRTKRSRTAEAIGGLASRQVANRAALARAKRTGNKEAISTAQAEVTEVDDQIRGLAVSVAQLDKTLAERTGPKAQAEMNLALAGLTETLQDDAAAQKTKVDLAQQELAAAKTSGDPGRIAEAATALKSELDAMKSLEDAIRGQRQQQVEMQSAIAGLTTTLNDDLTAQFKDMGLAAQEYTDALASGDKARIIAAANDLKSERDETEALRKRIVTQELEKNAALAALTTTLSDDMASQRREQQVAEREYKDALASGDSERITAAATAVKSERDETEALRKRVAYQEVEKDQALAGLTETLDDDADVQRKRVELARQELAAAEAANDPARIAEAATALKSEIDAMKSLEDAIRGVANQQAELDTALATLTATLTDDLGAQLEEQRLAEREYVDALASGDKARLIAAVNDLKSERDETKALRQRIVDQGLDKDDALAGLTETLQDDMEVAERRVKLSEAELKAAKASGDDDRIIEAATRHRQNLDSVKSLRDAMNQNTEVVEDNTNAITELAKEMAKQNEYANAVQSVTTAAAVRALADVMSGQLGPRLGVQRQSAGSADVSARY